MSGEHLTAKGILHRQRMYLVRYDPIEGKEITLLSPKIRPYTPVKRPVFTIGSLPKSTEHISSINAKDLEKEGYVIVSLNIRDNWFPGQSKMYKIVNKNHLPPLASLVVGIPHGHEVEYDKVDKKIRLVGRNADPTGIGDWMYV